MPENDLNLADLEDWEVDDFDAAEYLTSPAAVAAYLTEALDANDAAILAMAVGNIARARGMAEIAKTAGLTREGLYKALRPGSQPRLETITRVISALGVRLVAQVRPSVASEIPAGQPAHELTRAGEPDKRAPLPRRARKA